MGTGHRVFYDLQTGEVLFITPELSHGTGPTVEEDINKYDFLKNRDRSSFDFIELEYGQYAQDFAECNGVRISLETRTLEFSYPDPNEPNPREPVYRKPLSEQVEQLEQQLITVTGLVNMLLLPPEM